MLRLADCGKPEGLTSPAAASIRSYRDRVPLGELPLVPVRIDRRDFAGLVEPADLFARQAPAGCAKVLPQLLFVARAQNE